MKQPTNPNPVFTVSVASNLVGVSPQTLRRWERYGLVCPVREGRSRRRLYSWHEVERAQEIRYLVIRKHVPLREVKVQLRPAVARKAPGLPATSDGRTGAPLIPRLALGVPH